MAANHKIASHKACKATFWMKSGRKGLIALPIFSRISLICCLKVPIVSDEGRRGAHRTQKNRHRLEAMPILIVL